MPYKARPLSIHSISNSFKPIVCTPFRKFATGFIWNFYGDVPKRSHGVDKQHVGR